MDGDTLNKTDVREEELGASSYEVSDLIFATPKGTPWTLRT